jgi:inosine-uridine nucleoside N-ribohydrolase
MDSPSEAVSQLINVTRAQPPDTQVAWIAQGSLRNVAGALYHAPALARRITRLYIMGGNLMRSEFNFRADAEATAFVLALPHVPRFVVTIQTCQWAVVHKDALLNTLGAPRCKGSYASEHLRRLREHAELMMAVNAAGHWGPLPALHGEEKLGFFPWDAVAISAAVDGEEAFFADIRCQRLNATAERTVATDAPCDDPAASAVPYVFHPHPFVEVLLDRLCRDGKAAGEQVAQPS